MLSCKNCNIDFKPRSTGNVYCSTQCRIQATAWKADSRQCQNPECSAQFIPTRTHRDKIYCSRSCSATVNNARNPKRVRVSGSANCQGCSKSMRGLAGKKYCSKVCESNSKRSDLLEAWLTTGEGSIGSKTTHYIRQYLYVQQNYACSICSMSNEWQGKELKFILDHIDGNAENNSRCNLRLICPNCDSQLDTFKSKNKGKGRHSRRIRYANGQSY